jgi:predicted permease
MNGLFHGFLQDLRYGTRTLAKHPAFALVAILTLALGIGANTAIFHMLDSVLLRALPLPHPEELVLLTDPEWHGHSYGSDSGNRSILAYWEFQYLHDHNDVWSGIFAADSQLSKSQVIISRATSEEAKVRLVSGDYFSTLGVTPILGRAFGPEADKVRGAAPYAVASYSYWDRRFARDPSILGTKISIHQTPFEIVAVAPPGFFGETVGESPDLWVPLTMQDAIYPGVDLLATTPGVLDQRMWLQVMARRKPGITLRQADANVAIVFRRVTELAIGTLSAQDRRQYAEQRLTLRPGAQGASVLRQSFSEPLRLLMALVGLVLLIACANVANLLLARGAAREKEFALRLAIGAGRGRAIRQLLAESLLLAVPGAIAGFLLAQWADAILLHMVSATRGRAGAIQLDVHPDARMLLFTAAVAVLTSVLFGLAPALRLTRLDLSEALKSGPVSPSGGSVRRRLSAGKLLVVAQVSASLVMLVATGLFVHSLVELAEVNLGFNRDHLLAFRVDPGAGGWKGPAILRLHEQLLERLSNVPGVRSVALTADGLFEESEAGDPIAVEGYTPQAGEQLNTRMDHVGPNYFATVGIPILMGRGIGPQDSAGESVAVVNQTFAQKFFPHANPLGKHVRDTYYPTNPQEMTIVGVVADARYNSLREKTPTRLYRSFFRPLWEQDSAMYEVRTFGDSSAVASALRQLVHETAPSLPPVDVHAVAELVDASIATDRLVARLSAAFGLLAMLLVSIGLYGVMTWTMARRTREIGVRMALGARPSGILQLVLRETLLVVSIGIAIGIPLALAGTRLIQGMLFGVSGIDPVVIVSASILLIAVATIAGYLPARRASRVDPMIALRHE